MRSSAPGCSPTSPRSCCRRRTASELNHGEDITLVAGLHQLRGRSSRPSTTTPSSSSTRTGPPPSSSSSPRRTAAPGCSPPRSCRAGCAADRTTSRATPSWRTRIAGQGRRARHLDHRDRRPRTCRSSTPRRTCGSSSARACPTSGGSPSASARPPTREDNLRLGRALGDAIAESTARSLLIASGALSHTFWPLRELREHEAAGAEHIFTPEAAAADARAHRLVRPGRPRPGPRDDAGVLPVQARGPVRALPDDGRRPRRGRLHGAEPPVRRVRELRSAPARSTSGSTGPRAASRGPRPTPVAPTTSASPVPDLPAAAERHVMTEYRRILLDGAAVEVVRHGDVLVAGTAARSAVERRRAPAARSSRSKIICRPPQLRAAGSTSSMTELPAGADLLPQAGRRRSTRHGGAVVRPERCQWLNYEGEIAIVIGRTCRNISPARGRRLHRRLHRRQRLRPARLPRHRRRLDAAGQGLGHPLPARPRPGHRLGLPRQADPHPASTARSRQDGNTDEMEWDMHYLVADIARTITLHPGDVLLSGTPANSRTVYPGDVVEVEVEGLGPAAQPHRHRTGADPRPTSAPSPPSPKRSSPPRWAATGSSAASATPSKTRPVTEMPADRIGFRRGGLARAGLAVSLPKGLLIGGGSRAATGTRAVVTPRDGSTMAGALRPRPPMPTRPWPPHVRPSTTALAADAPARASRECSAVRRPDRARPGRARPPRQPRDGQADPRRARDRTARDQSAACATTASWPTRISARSRRPPTASSRW